MPWLQLSFEIKEAQQDALEALLFDHGAQTISLSDALDNAQYEPAPGETPMWPTIKLSALFSAQLDPQQLLSTLNASNGITLPPCQIEYLADKDWEREWMQHFKPIQMGQRLWICPSWISAPHPNAVNLILDPGLAFGTGTHPTTALCLQWLDQQASNGKLNSKTLIDYGCGSGILAIAALLLGAQQAIGIDHDEQAIIASKNNAAKNNISQNALTVFHSEHQPQTLHADIILANILAKPLLQLTKKFTNICKKDDKLILSGILNEQVENICDKYKKDFIITNISYKDGWSRIDCTKK